MPAPAFIAQSLGLAEQRVLMQYIIWYRHSAAVGKIATAADSSRHRIGNRQREKSQEHHHHHHRHNIARFAVYARQVAAKPGGSAAGPLYCKFIERENPQYSPLPFAVRMPFQFPAIPICRLVLLFTFTLHVTFHMSVPASPSGSGPCCPERRTERASRMLVTHFCHACFPVDLQISRQTSGNWSSRPSWGRRIRLFQLQLGHRPL